MAETEEEAKQRQDKWYGKNILTYRHPEDHHREDIKVNRDDKEVIQLDRNNILEAAGLLNITTEEIQQYKLLQTITPKG